jgi:hypothetical protein
MAELKGYGLMDYANCKTYEDFLEKGEDVLYISDNVEFLVSEYNNNQGSGKITLNGPFVVTNYRTFMAYEKKSLSGIFGGKKEITIDAEAIYDFEYAKKEIVYAIDALKRIAASGGGLKVMDVTKEEMEHRPNITRIPLLESIDINKSLFGGETMKVGIFGLTFGATAAKFRKIGEGIQSIFSLGRKRDGKDWLAVHDIDVKSPFRLASQVESKYVLKSNYTQEQVDEFMKKYPKCGQAVAYLETRIEDNMKNIEKLKELAKKSEEIAFS